MLLEFVKFGIIASTTLLHSGCTEINEKFTHSKYFKHLRVIDSSNYRISKFPYEFNLNHNKWLEEFHLGCVHINNSVITSVLKLFKPVDISQFKKLTKLDLGFLPYESTRKEYPIDLSKNKQLIELRLSCLRNYHYPFDLSNNKQLTTLTLEYCRYH